ncbi:MAG: hypothetical protein GX333_01775 [Syntrophomonadaceae bacterium]|nr:hypothetical protein [Syntrophomonadaceae bacterium]
MTYKSWFFSTLLIIALPLLVVASFNYYIDPLWNFNCNNKYNNKQMPFNERQQKTNYITFHKFDYDSLILGSSRTTYIKQTDFVGLNAYNYAVNNMLIDEYYDYIEYAKKVKGSDFDYIIIGLDFYASNKNLDKEFAEPAHYIANTNQFGYRFTSLISRDTLDYAKQNYAAALEENPINYTYNRENIKSLFKVSEEESVANIETTLNTYRTKIYANYEYTNVREMLEKIKNSNPNTRFIIFTTPVNHKLYNLMLELDLSTHYQQLINDVVEVFGEVYDFNYPNAITTDDRNYFDGSHFYPEIGTLIAHRISNLSTELATDFGTLITKVK